MAPRLNRRQQREQEELLVLGVSTSPVESEEDEQGLREVSAQSGFAALMAQEDGEDEASAEEEPQAAKSKKPKKKKKKKPSASTAAQSPISAEPSKPLVASTPQVPPSAKKSGKKKVKEKKDDGDDLDKALAELSIKYPEWQKNSNSASTSKSASSPSHSLSSLLSVSLPNLDSEAEMKRFFGAKVVAASKASSSSSPGPRRVAGAERSNLTKPRPTWWPAKMREGLSVRSLSEDEIEDKLERMGWVNAGEEKWWTVEYSKKYKGATMAFIQTVMSGDPEGFYRLLRLLPWHADNLLQLSEVYRHREEYSEAVDFVERALFAYERAFVGAFNFTSGINRLDFDHVENRPFFLALHRQITDLQRKGCVRTAFEFARLLYALDPWTDPHGALLHLDFLALKANMGQWLLDVYDYFGVRAQDKTMRGRANPALLPGWSFSKALAIRMMEDAKRSSNHDNSTEALKQAITNFPSVVPLLADKIEVSLPAEIRSHRAFKIETDGSGLSPATACMHMLSHLYAQRSFQLWKDAPISAWFSSTLVDLASQFTSRQPPSSVETHFLDLYLTAPSLRHSLYRHVLVLEATTRRLFPFLPRDVVSSKHLACDPLPPPTRVNEYDGEFFKGSEDIFAVRMGGRRGGRAEQRMMERLVPDPVFRRQLQEFFNAHPNFAERFPGGVVQFAQLAGQLPEEVLMDLMVAEAGGMGAGNMAMPGGMPEEQIFVDFTDEEADGDQEDPRQIEQRRDHDDDDRHSEDEDGEDDSIDDTDVAPLPVRLLRNLMNRFWGRTSPSQNDDSSDGEQEDVHRPTMDDEGVD